MNKNKRTLRPGLILTRKAGERIYIGDNIIVSVLNLGSRYTCLHISAPQDVSILREEVRQRQQAEIEDKGQS